jgi:sec-independent protein translocase protein TatA
LLFNELGNTIILFIKGVEMLGTGEILVILVIVLILFGGKKLPEFAQSLGKGIREFKKACNGEEDDSIIIRPKEEEMRPKPQETPEEK